MSRRIHRTAVHGQGCGWLTGGHDSESLDSYVTRQEFEDLVDKVRTLEGDIISSLEDMHRLLEGLIGS